MEGILWTMEPKLNFREGMLRDDDGLMVDALRLDGVLLSEFLRALLRRGSFLLFAALRRRLQAANYMSACLDATLKHKHPKVSVGFDPLRVDKHLLMSRTSAPQIPKIK